MEFKSDMKSLWDEMKQEFEQLEEKVTSLNETVKKHNSRLEKAEIWIKASEEGPTTIERITDLIIVQSEGTTVLGGDINLLMN